MAHKKGVGSSKNGRESESKRLGVRRYRNLPQTPRQQVVRFYPTGSSSIIGSETNNKSPTEASAQVGDFCLE